MRNFLSRSGSSTSRKELGGGEGPGSGDAGAGKLDKWDSKEVQGVSHNQSQSKDRGMAQNGDGDPNGSHGNNNNNATMLNLALRSSTVSSTSPSSSTSRQHRNHTSNGVRLQRKGRAGRRQQGGRDLTHNEDEDENEDDPFDALTKANTLANTPEGRRQQQADRHRNRQGGNDTETASSETTIVRKRSSSGGGSFSPSNYRHPHSHHPNHHRSRVSAPPASSYAIGTGKPPSYDSLEGEIVNDVWNEVMIGRRRRQPHHQPPLPHHHHHYEGQGGHDGEERGVSSADPTSGFGGATFLYNSGIKGGGGGNNDDGSSPLTKSLNAASGSSSSKPEPPKPSNNTNTMTTTTIMSIDRSRREALEREEKERVKNHRRKVAGKLKRVAALGLKKKEKDRVFKDWKPPTPVEERPWFSLSLSTFLRRPPIRPNDPPRRHTDPTINKSPTRVPNPHRNHSFPETTTVADNFRGEKKNYSFFRHSRDENGREHYDETGSQEDDEDEDEEDYDGSGTLYSSSASVSSGSSSSTSSSHRSDFSSDIQHSNADTLSSRRSFSNRDRREDATASQSTSNDELNDVNDNVLPLRRQSHLGLGFPSGNLVGTKRAYDSGAYVEGDDDDRNGEGGGFQESSNESPITSRPRQVSAVQTQTKESLKSSPTMVELDIGLKGEGQQQKQQQQQQEKLRESDEARNWKAKMERMDRWRRDVIVSDDNGDNGGKNENVVTAVVKQVDDLKKNKSKPRSRSHSRSRSLPTNLTPSPQQQPLRKHCHRPTGGGTQDSEKTIKVLLKDGSKIRVPASRLVWETKGQDGKGVIAGTAARLVAA